MVTIQILELGLLELLLIRIQQNVSPQQHLITLEGTIAFTPCLAITLSSHFHPLPKVDLLTPNYHYFFESENFGPAHHVFKLVWPHGYYKGFGTICYTETFVMSYCSVNDAIAGQ